MKVGLLKACVVSLIISNANRICADGWFSDLMVRAFHGTRIGNFFMDDTQKQIYSFEQKKKEAEKIRIEFLNDSASITDQAIQQLQSCKALPVVSGMVDNKMLKAKFQEYLKSTDAVTMGRDFSKTKGYPIKVPEVPKLILTDDEIINVGKCAKTNSAPSMQKLSRLIDLTDEINIA